MKKIVFCLSLFIFTLSAFSLTDYQVEFKNDTKKYVLIAFIRRVEDNQRFAFKHIFLGPYQSKVATLIPTDRIDMTFDFDIEESTYRNQAGAIYNHMTSSEGLHLMNNEGKIIHTLSEGESYQSRRLPSILIARKLSIVITADFLKEEIYISVYSR